MVIWHGGPKFVRAEDEDENGQAAKSEEDDGEVVMDGASPEKSLTEASKILEVLGTGNQVILRLALLSEIYNDTPFGVKAFRGGVAISGKIILREALVEGEEEEIIETLADIIPLKNGPGTEVANGRSDFFFIDGKVIKRAPEGGVGDLAEGVHNTVTVNYDTGDGSGLLSIGNLKIEVTEFKVEDNGYKVKAKLKFDSTGFEPAPWPTKTTLIEETVELKIRE